MIAPAWLRNRTQPIAIADVLEYLVQAAERPEADGREVQIGGPDVLTYSELLDLMADVLGTRRRPKLPVPLLTPRLSSLWIGLITPVDAGVARPLIESLRERHGGHRLGAGGAVRRGADADVEALRLAREEDARAGVRRTRRPIERATRKVLLQCRRSRAARSAAVMLPDRGTPRHHTDWSSQRSSASPVARGRIRRSCRSSSSTTAWSGEVRPRRSITAASPSMRSSSF